MEEAVADINLMKTPPSRDCKREDKANGGRLHKWVEHITIVNAVLLSEATSDEM